MFVEEAQLATRLNHPNIVQVYEFQDYGDEGLLLSMEYVEGPDLGKLMSAAKAKATRIPPWVAAFIIAEAARVCTTRTSAKTRRHARSTSCTATSRRRTSFSATRAR